MGGRRHTANTLKQVWIRSVSKERLCRAVPEIAPWSVPVSLAVALSPQANDARVVPIEPAAAIPVGTAGRGADGKEGLLLGDLPRPGWGGRGGPQAKGNVSVLGSDEPPWHGHWSSGSENLVPMAEDAN